MKICPVCNDSFADQLNFCDIDGARLAREGSVQERNKWWSLLGAGLLVGAVVISAASIIFLPRARVSTPVVNSEPPPSSVPPKTLPAESAANVATPAANAEPESVPTDAAVPEVKRKDKALANGNFSGAAPNPKAAALASDEADKKSTSAQVNGAVPSASKKSEAPSSVKSVGDTRSADAATKPPTPPDLKKDQKSQTATAKNSDKDSNDKKKNEEKDKKKGGFLRVFKKIFGKG